MTFKRTAIPEVILFEPRVFGDDRGFFFESFNEKVFVEAVGKRYQFVQDNHSRSSRGVLRGLHYQLPPNAQGKLVRVIVGEVFDVAVDIRKGSPTFGRWVGEVLSTENRLQMWIPPGFAHGFLSLSEGAEVFYKATAFYNPEAERSIAWNDPDIGIVWPFIGAPIVSIKDAVAQSFSSAEAFVYVYNRL
jgi:dTDP-4-dehydrorhamnose 3,5-epimerase